MFNLHFNTDADYRMFLMIKEKREVLENELKSIPFNTSRLIVEEKEKAYGEIDARYKELLRKAAIGE